MKQRDAWVSAIAPLVGVLVAAGCGRDAGPQERVSSESEALYYCRTVTIVATTTYSGNSRSIETDGVTYTPAAQIAVPATIPVTTGGSGPGTADFSITTNDATTDCTYTGNGATSYVFKSCSDGHASGVVLSATEATLTVNDGDESNPAHETVATLTLVEQGGCVPVDAGTTDAGAHDAGTHDAASADSGPRDAGSADSGHDSGVVDSGADASDAGAKTDAGSGCSTSADCNDQNPCTTDSCSSKKCKHTTVKSGTACNDGNLCDGQGQCNASGTCVLGPPPTINTSNRCVIGSCDPIKGVTYTNAAAGTSCSDGNLCHGTQTCGSAGNCVATNVPVVPGSTVCLTSACDPATGLVTQTPQAAGYACSADRCFAPQDCDGTGNCVNVPPPVMDDGNPCTTDTCAGSVGVVHQPVPAGTACGDNSNPCVGAFTCNAGATCIQAPTPPLDDGNACTLDACTPATGITHTPVTINQDNPCSLGACDPAAGLTYTPAPAGTSCSDGNACNGAETCDGSGTCQSALPLPVSDGNPCTIDWCDAALGVEHAPAPSGTSCSDGNACNGVESCDANGSCAPGTPPTTDDGNACTTDGCDPLLGVTHLPVASAACLASEAAWTATSDGRPSPRDSAAAVYDPGSSSTLLFAGENAGAALADLWSFDGVARTWTPRAGVGPSPRAGAAVTLDSQRGKLVVFGGNAGGASGTSVLGDTWEYDLSTRAWSQSALSAPAPSARAYASMAFDPSHRQVVLFGGESPAGPQAADGPWTWDGQVWTLQSAAGNASPPSRFGASLAWLPSSAHLVLFGGASSALPNVGSALGDTWELDPSSWTWSESTGDGPPARTAQAMALDSARGCLVLFGGTSDDARNLGDTWEYAGSWAERTTAAAPPARAGHTLAFDSGRGKTLLFGGLSYSSTGTTTPGFDDTWEYDGPSGAWSPAAASVSPAALHVGAVLDSRRGVLVARGDEPVPQMWEADATSLQFASKGAFTASTDFGAALLGALGGDVGPQPMAYVASRARTLFVTMGSGAAYYPVPGPPTPVGTWEWDGAQWTNRACTGAPLALSQATLTYDTARDRVVLYGGLVGAGVATQNAGPTANVWELDPAACAWSPGVATGPVRVNALGAWDSDRARLVVFGGAPSSSSPLASDTWELDTAGGTWVQRATTGPTARSGAAMTYDARRKRVVVFGGTPNGSTGPTAELWEYDGVGGIWTQATPSGAAPPGRINASLVFDPARGTSVLVGGSDASGSRFDSWEWDGVAWTRRRTGASPAARSGAEAAWSPTRRIAILFGGVRGDGERALMRDTWFWRDGDWARLGADRPEPIAHVASNNNLDGALPDARAGHSLCVASDGRVLLFGGEGDTGLLADGWTLAPGSSAWSSAGGVFQPPARTNASLVPLDTGCFLFGGLGSAGPLADLWKTDVYGNWSLVQGYGPVARSAHAMTYDPSRRVVVLFGGLGASGPLADTWEWSLDTNAWTARTPATSPPARLGHRLVLDSARSVVVLVGGMGAAPGSAASDTWEYSGATGQWTLREPAVSLPPRAGHVAFFDPSAAATVVFGGLAHRDSGSALTYGDTWVYARGGAADAEPPRYPLSARCNAGSDCATGQCVDGVCCESACAGQCAACNVPGSEGRCVAVSGAPVGSRAPCASVPACALACDGSDSSGCHSQAGNACAAGTCTGGASLAVSRCDSAGVCVPGRRHVCAPLACNEASCACAADADCGDPSYFCGSGACRPYARLTSFALSTPIASGWGSTVTATATAIGTIDPVFSFSYAEPPPASVSYGAACGGVGTCTMSLPPGNGSWVVTVQVKDRASPNAFDDTRQLTVPSP